MEDLKHINGIWLVTKRNDEDVELSHLSRFIRRLPDDDGVRTLVIPKILKQVLTNQYGESMDLNIGALVKVTWTPDDPRTGVLGFHMANVAPGDDHSRMQYDYALGILGLRAAIQPGAWVGYEGRFNEAEKMAN